MLDLIEGEKMDTHNLRGGNLLNPFRQNTTPGDQLLMS